MTEQRYFVRGRQFPQQAPSVSPLTIPLCLHLSNQCLLMPEVRLIAEHNFLGVYVLKISCLADPNSSNTLVLLLTRCQRDPWGDLCLEEAYQDSWFKRHLPKIGLEEAYHHFWFKRHLPKIGLDFPAMPALPLDADANVASERPTARLATDVWRNKMHLLQSFCRMSCTSSNVIWKALEIGNILSLTWCVLYYVEYRLQMYGDLANS